MFDKKKKKLDIRVNYTKNKTKPYFIRNVL